MSEEEKTGLRKEEKHSRTLVFLPQRCSWFMVTHQNIKLTQEWQKCRQNVSNIYIYIYLKKSSYESLLCLWLMTETVAAFLFPWLSIGRRYFQRLWGETKFFPFTAKIAHHSLTSIFRTDAKKQTNSANSKYSKKKLIFLCLWPSTTILSNKERLG